VHPRPLHPTPTVLLIDPSTILTAVNSSAYPIARDTSGPFATCRHVSCCGYATVLLFLLLLLLSGLGAQRLHYRFQRQLQQRFLTANPAASQTTSPLAPVLGCRRRPICRTAGPGSAPVLFPVQQLRRRCYIGGQQRRGRGRPRSHGRRAARLE
jgi:hypothetical protein